MGEPARAFIPQPIMLRIRDAIGDNCSICGLPMDFDCASDDPMRPSVEHVVPRSKGGGHTGNRLIAHHACNQAKRDRNATGCEMILLGIANDVLTGRVVSRTPLMLAELRTRAIRSIKHHARNGSSYRLSPGQCVAIAEILEDPNHG